MHWPVWKFERHQPRPPSEISNLPLFCLTSSLGSRYTGVFFSPFFFGLRTNNNNIKKSVPQSWRTYIQKDKQYINRKKDAPHSHSISCLTTVYDTPCMFSALPHLEGTCFPRTILSPKLCFLGLTMCATSGCNPTSQAKVTLCLTILRWRHGACTEGRFHSVRVVASRFQPPGLIDFNTAFPRRKPIDSS